MRKPVWLCLIVAGLVIAFDQLGKYLVATSLPLGGAWSPFPGDTPVLRIVYIYNTGVAFGLFKGLGPVFIGLALIVTAAILFYSRKLRSDQWLSALALGLLLGGALGNVIDRLRLGQVVDFIDVGVGATRWYTSNLADVSIVLGVILLGLATLLDGQHDRPPARPNNAETQPVQNSNQ